MFSPITVGRNAIQRSRRFYDAVFAEMGVDPDGNKLCAMCRAD